MTQPEEKKKAPLLDHSIIAFAVLAIITAAICYSKGRGVFDKGLADSFTMLRQLLPKMAGAMLLAGFVQVLLPREMVMELIGEKSGLKGMVIASFAGILMPGGPMVSFPLISALYALGASNGTLVAYLISWELMGMQRILIWELPLMGVKFTALRVFISLSFPLLAGILSQKLTNYFNDRLKREA